MGIYTDLSNAELDEEIATLRTARRQVMTEGVSKIAGEGRSIEYSRADSTRVERSLRDAIAERSRRAGRCNGHAIPVEFD